MTLILGPGAGGSSGGGGMAGTTIILGGIDFGSTLPAAGREELWFWLDADDPNAKFFVEGNNTEMTGATNGDVFKWQNSRWIRPNLNRTLTRAGVYGITKLINQGSSSIIVTPNDVADTLTYTLAPNLLTKVNASVTRADLNQNYNFMSNNFDSITNIAAAGGSGFAFLYSNNNYPEDVNAIANPPAGVTVNRLLITTNASTSHNYADAAKTGANYITPIGDSLAQIATNGGDIYFHNVTASIANPFATPIAGAFWRFTVTNGTKFGNSYIMNGTLQIVGSMSNLASYYTVSTSQISPVDKDARHLTNVKAFFDQTFRRSIATPTKVLSEDATGLGYTDPTKWNNAVQDIDLDDEMRYWVFALDDNSQVSSSNPNDNPAIGFYNSSNQQVYTDENGIPSNIASTVTTVQISRYVATGPAEGDDFAGRNNTDALAFLTSLYQNGGTLVVQDAHNPKNENRWELDFTPLGGIAPNQTNNKGTYNVSAFRQFGTLLSSSGFYQIALNVRRNITVSADTLRNTYALFIRNLLSGGDADYNLYLKNDLTLGYAPRTISDLITLNDNSWTNVLTGLANGTTIELTVWVNIENGAMRSMTIAQFSDLRTDSLRMELPVELKRTGTTLQARRVAGQTLTYNLRAVRSGG